MANKKAIITGGSRGIGRGIALKLASQGYDVAISYHTREDSARSLQQEIREKYGTKCYYYQASLEKPGVARQLFDQAMADLGGLDLLVCNAGISRGGSFVELDEELLDRMLELDYKSYLLLTSYAANFMVDHEVRGNIIYTTSTHGERAYAFDTVYGSLKAGLNRAVQSLALELGSYGIRVNAVAPGFTKVRFGESIDFGGNTTIEQYDTHYREFGGMIPLNRCGYPEDIANAVAFLASEKARYITGLTVKVDGGLVLPGMPESTDPANNRRVWGYREHYGFQNRKQREENKQNDKGENKP